MKYRPEIDGLRTIAVVPVILFHAGFTVFSGGFIGVDVFFVISGYLITTILIGELERDDFSILRFYERRARRILPALFAVIVCTIPMAWIQLDPVRFTDFSESIIATMLFASNFLFWLESGYFDVDAENKPLLHTWSLAVEEQYYLFFPVLLFLLWRYGRRSTLGVIVGLTLLSFLLCLWGARNASSANFYLLPFRMWELFVGSICAFFLTKGALAPQTGYRGNQILAGAGLALILGGIFLIDGGMRFPGAVTLAPVLGTALIILFARPGTWVAGALSVKPMVWIGLLSYSLYLWHQPIFAIARLKFGHNASPVMMAGLIGLALVLSFLTWRFIETPFRKRPNRAPLLVQRPRLFAASGAAVAVFAAFGVFGIATGGAAMRFPESYSSLLAGFEDRAPDTCKYGPADPLPVHPMADCLFPVDGAEAAPVMLLGDSHAWAASQEFAAALTDAGIPAYVATHEACAPVPVMYDLSADQGQVDRCARFIAGAFDWAEDAGVERVVIVARFTAHYFGSIFDNGEGGIEDSTGPARKRDVIWDPNAAEIPAAEERLARIRASIPEQLAALSQRFDLVILDPIPEAGWHVPGHGITLMKETGEVPHLTTDYEAVRARTEPARTMLRAIQEYTHGTVTFVPVEDLFCHADTGRCDNIVDGVPLYFDDDHVTNAGARLIAPRVVEAVQP